MQFAMQAIVDCLACSVENVNRAASDLLKMCTEGMAEQDALNEYITLVTKHSTGNLYWRYVCLVRVDSVY